MTKKALIIFVKNPIPGNVKTRIARSVGDQRAAEIYIELLRHTRREVLKCETNRFVYYGDHINPSDLWTSAKFVKRMQRQSDLGARMHRALQEVLTNHDSAVIIGSDCLDMNAVYIEEAFTALQSSDLVIGPTYDGGYALIGLNKTEPSLFQDIEWSTERVYQQTIKAANKKGLKVNSLKKVQDIDYYQDWLKYHPK